MRLSRSLILFLLLLITFMVYQPGMFGDFEFDDISNITDNPKLVMPEFSLGAMREAAFSSYSGTLKRPVSMLSFAINASTTGLNQALYFKLTNLFIHLLNGVLVFWFARLCLTCLHRDAPPDDSPAWVPFLATAMWLLHPINLTSVLYVVQRMTSLSATFALISVCLYLAGRRRLMAQESSGWIFIAFALCVSMPLAILSKESGVLVPLLMLVIEWVFFRFDSGKKRDVWILKALFGASVLLPAACFILLTATNFSGLFGGYVLRDFSMSDRLLTQARVLWFYLRLLLLPSASRMGLFHDDFEISRNWNEPLDTALAIAALGLMLVLAFHWAKKLPMLAFGFLWFLGGHALEASSLPLEMIHEHRNYLPSLGPIFAAAYYLGSAAGSPDTARLRKIAAIGLTMLFAMVTTIRADQWSNLIYHAISEAENHPGSERANQQLGRMYFLLYVDTSNPAYYAGAIEALDRARRTKSISILAHVSLLQLYSFAKQPVDPTLFPEVAKKLEMLPLPPNAVPALRALVDCQLFAYCRLPDAEIVSLFKAALRNPRGHPSITTSLRVYLAQYYVDKMGDVVAGVNVLEEALKVDPGHLDVLLNLARVYRVMRLFERAETNLRLAEMRDVLGNRQSDTAAEWVKLRRDREADSGAAAK